MVDSIQTLWLGFIAIAAIVVMLRVIFNIITYVRFYRAKKGHYGDVSKWIAELYEEDMVFATYFSNLPCNHTIEVCVIAESKEELRTLTFERVDELT